MEQKPLYRRVNTKARGVHHRSGGDYRHQRNAKLSKSSEATHQSMGGKQRRGLDYTPLFRFLLSKVGCVWDQVHAAAVRRLDRAEPIFWLVALQSHERKDYVVVDESTFFSGLYVDEAGILQRVNPAMGPASLEPMCACCTHTFNGVRFTRRFRPDG